MSTIFTKQEMKKVLAGILFALGLTALTPTSSADLLESVDLVKFDTKNHDMVIERSNGDRYLIQHSRQCMSMDLDFPVKLFWNDKGEPTQVKVAFNEICDIYEYAPYDGEVTIKKRIKSHNILVPDHKAEIEWNNKLHRIEYDDGCKWLRLFIDKLAYIHTPEDTLENAVMYLPNHRGKCTISKAEYLEDLPDPSDKMPTLTGIDYKANSNEVYFYWDKLEDVEKPLYLISYSRRKINPADYEWDQMPNLIYTRDNTYTVEQLANGEPYYFYLAVVDANKNASDWVHVVATPEGDGGFTNDPWEKEFEIEIVEETDEYYRLQWPDLDSADKYMTYFYIDGKREWFDYIYDNEVIIEKKAKYVDTGLRLFVRALHTRPVGRHLYDGIYWRFDLESND